MKRKAFSPLLLMTFFTFMSQNLWAFRPPEHHWTEADTETLWESRYSNCDYGYFVLLDKGVIGHGSHSPNPNHGFLVPLPEVGKTSPAAYDTEQRYVWTDASYNLQDDLSLKAAVADAIQLSELSELQGGKSHVVERKSAKLAKLRAVQLRIEFTSANETMVDEIILAVRSNVIYTIGLRTTLQDRSVDEVHFQKLVHGFRLLKLPRGACGND